MGYGASFADINNFYFSYSVFVTCFFDIILHKTCPTDAFVLNLRKCMTRSSVKELTKPFDDPEKAFHSLKRLFNIKALDISSPTEVDYFSDQEPSKEVETETMTENATMEEYMNKTSSNYNSEIVRPKLNGNNWFVVRGQFLKLLQDNTFCGLENEDANKHMERTLEIANLYRTKNMTYNQFMLRVFPSTLAGEAMCWLNKEPTKSITSWVELKTKFLEKFSPEFACWMRSKFRYPEKMSSPLKN